MQKNLPLFAGIALMMMSFAISSEIAKGQTYFVTGGGNIYSIDFSSCNEALVCSGTGLTSIAFYNGLFYGTGTVGSANTLYTLNPIGCVLSNIGATPNSNLNALVADGAGNLYAAASGSGNIYKYDILTNTWTTVGTIPGYASAGDLTFFDGKLYGVSLATPNQFYEITLSPFSATLIGPIGTTSNEIFGTITSIPPGSCTGDIYAFIYNGGNMSIGVVDPANGNVTPLCNNFFSGQIYDGASIFESGMNLSMTASPLSVCSGDPTTITAQGGYTTYNWAGSGLSSTTGNPVVATPTATTTYSVTASSPGCTNTASITIETMPTINATASCSPNPACPGDAISLSALPTSTPIANITEDFESGSSFNFTNSGTNNRWTRNTGTRRNGAYSLYIYGIGAPTTYGASGNPTTSFAYRDITITGTTTANLQFYWKNAGTATSPYDILTVWKVPTTQTFAGLAGSGGTGLTDNATQDLLLTCTGQSNYTLANINLLPYTGQTIRLAFQWRNENGGTLAVPASIDDIVITQSSTNTFAWASTPAGFTSALQNPSTTAVASTTYTVTVSGGGMCPGTANVALTVDPLPTVTASAVPATVCPGQTVTLSASGASTYVWSSGSTTVAPMVTTTYTVTGTSAAGCTGTATVMVTVNSSATITASASPANICNGESSTITASGANTYTWSPSGSGASFTATPGSTTTYSVTGTTAAGCTGATTVTLTVEPFPTVIATATPATICIGQNSTIAASGANTYTWSPSGSGASFTATPSSTTTYSVTGTSAAGCTNTATVTLTVNPLPTVTATATPAAICIGENSTIAASGANTYTWSPSGSGASFTATPGSTTTYTVTGTSAAGCTNTATVTVTVNSFATITASASPATICIGESSTITASGANTYTWSPSGSGASFTATPGSTTTYSVTGTTAAGCTGATTVTLTVEPFPTVIATATPATICIGQNSTIAASGANTYTWSPSGSGASFTATPSSTTTYSVTGTTAAGCTGATTVTLTVNPLPTVTASATPAAICIGESATIAAAGANTYVWSPSGSGASFTATPSSTTTYTVTGTSAAGCTNIATVTLTVNPLPNITATASPAAICLGYSSTITGGGGTSYIWDNGQNVTSFTESPIATTTYNVTGTDANNCRNTATVTVTLMPNLTVLVTPDIDDICNGENTTLTASSPGSGVGYTWDNGYNTASITVSPAATTSYSVTGTDAQGCTGTATAVVNVNPLPSVSFVADPLTGCDPTTINFTDLSTSNITIWEWEFGDSGISGLQNPSHTYGAGSYSVSLTVTTAAGCQSSLTLSNYITILSNPIASFIANPKVTTEDNPTIIFIDESTGASIYSWNFGDGSGISESQNPVYTYLESGEYEVNLWVENAAGCVDSTKALIVVKPIFTFYLPNSFTPNDDGVNDDFRPFGTGWDIDNYSMYIFSRWGEQVFKTTDINHVWNGMMPDGITPAQDECYSVLVYIMGLDGKEHHFIERLILFR